MYLTPTLNLNERQFLALCDEKGFSKSYSKRALNRIFRELDDLYSMEDEDNYMEATCCFEQCMKTYKEYTFEQLSERFGYLIDPEWKSRPFYQLHTTLMLAMIESDDFEVNFLFDNPDCDGADTYLVFFKVRCTEDEAQ